MSDEKRVVHCWARSIALTPTEGPLKWRSQSRFLQTPCLAPRCGVFLVVCEKCGYSAAITTAGRPDDPRKVTLPCKLH